MSGKLKNLCGILQEGSKESKTHLVGSVVTEVE
jgi:hypothetical protein